MKTNPLVQACVLVYKFIHYFFAGLLLLPKTLINSSEKKDINKPKKKDINVPKKKDKVEELGNKVIETSKNINKKIDNKITEKNNKKVRPLFEINYDRDGVKSAKKQTYRYEVSDNKGKFIVGYFEAFSIVEVYSYLLNEGYTIHDIKTSYLINLLHGANTERQAKIKIKDLIFMTAQLSTYLKVGIPLADAVKKLTKQFKNPNHLKILNAVSYDLSIGTSFSEALEKQGKAFPGLYINMIRTAEMTGQLPETLDEMEDYYTETEATRKAMVSAMMYPTIIFIIAIGVGLFIMLFVVPKFVDIYNSMDNTEIPGITKFVLWLSQFLSNYALLLGLLAIVLILTFAYLYKKVKSFRKTIQWIGMKIPVISNVIIFNEVTMFTKTFSSLLANNVFITDSMEILNKITNNEIYREMINGAMNNVAKGGKISTAFKDQWAFPVPAYEMIVTGEDTGQLAEMMGKVANYYQDLHKNSVARIKAFVEPLLIIMLTVMVGVIVLSIVVPMFNMYTAIQQG